MFRTMLKSPFEAREERGLRRMQALLKSIMLRRTKQGVSGLLIADRSVLSFVAGSALVNRLLVVNLVALEDLNPLFVLAFVHYNGSTQWPGRAMP